MMDTPGTVLRSERERQEKSLKDVARKLKINIKYLEAIEDDDYAVLPADVFARSYIRLYADELDLDSSKLLALFENIGEAPAAEEEGPQEEAPPAPPLSPSGERRKRPFTPYLIIAAAGLIIVVLILTLQKGERDGKEAGPVVRKESAHQIKEAAVEKERPPAETLPAEKRERVEAAKPGEKPGPPPVHVEEERAATAVPAPKSEKPAEEKAPVMDERTEVVKPAPEPQSERSAPVRPAVPVEQKPAAKTAEPGMVHANTAGEMTLKVVATELTWISLSIDGAPAQEWHLRPGEIITLKGRSGFSGKVGNAGGTRLYLDNKDLGELGPPGTIIDITLPQQ
jgi:cytoskeleton protein RodZ